MPDPAPFTIEGPDADGDVWLYPADDPGRIAGYNLGKVDQAAEVMSGWLGSIDHEERSF